MNFSALAWENVPKFTPRITPREYTLRTRVTPRTLDPFLRNFASPIFLDM